MEHILQLQSIGKDFARLESSGRALEMRDLIAEIMNSNVISKESLKLIFSHMVDEVSGHSTSTSNVSEKNNVDSRPTSNSFKKKIQLKSPKIPLQSPLSQRILSPSMSTPYKIISPTSSNISIHFSSPTNEEFNKARGKTVFNLLSK